MSGEEKPKKKNATAYQQLMNSKNPTAGLLKMMGQAGAKAPKAQKKPAGSGETKRKAKPKVVAQSKTILSNSLLSDEDEEIEMLRKKLMKLQRKRKAHEENAAKEVARSETAGEEVKKIKKKKSKKAKIDDAREMSKSTKVTDLTEILQLSNLSEADKLKLSLLSDVIDMDKLSKSLQLNESKLNHSNKSRKSVSSSETDDESETKSKTLGTAIAESLSNVSSTKLSNLSKVSNKLNVSGQSALNKSNLNMNDARDSSSDSDNDDAKSNVSRASRNSSTLITLVKGLRSPSANSVRHLALKNNRSLNSSKLSLNKSVMASSSSETDEEVPPVKSNATVKGNATVKSNATVKANATVKSNATVKGNATVKNSYSVGMSKTVKESSSNDSSDDDEPVKSVNTSLVKSNKMTPVKMQTSDTSSSDSDTTRKVLPKTVKNDSNVGTNKNVKAGDSSLKPPVKSKPAIAKQQNDSSTSDDDSEDESSEGNVKKVAVKTVETALKSPVKLQTQIAKKTNDSSTSDDDSEDMSNNGNVKTVEAALKSPVKLKTQIARKTNDSSSSEDESNNQNGAVKNMKATMKTVKMTPVKKERNDTSSSGSDESVRPPVKQASPVKVNKDKSDTSSSDESVKQNAKQVSARNGKDVKSTVKMTPAKTDSSTSGSDESDSNVKQKNVSAVKDLKAKVSDSSSSDSESDIEMPVKTQVVKSPVKTQVVKSPVKTQVVKSPVKTQVVKSPVKMKASLGKQRSDSSSSDSSESVKVPANTIKKTAVTKEKQVSSSSDSSEDEEAKPVKSMTSVKLKSAVETVSPKKLNRSVNQMTSDSSSSDSDGSDVKSRKKKSNEEKETSKVKSKKRSVDTSVEMKPVKVEAVRQSSDSEELVAKVTKQISPKKNKFETSMNHFSDSEGEFRPKQTQLFRQHVNENKLRPVETKSFKLKDGEEVYLVKLPKALHPQHLSDMKINFDKPKSLKIENSKFVCNVEKKCADLWILNNGDLRNVKTDGTITFSDDSPVKTVKGDVDLNESNISLSDSLISPSLPDLNKRHPLFGANYKKKMKFDASISKKLDGIFEELQANFESKKKKKKLKQEKEIEADIFNLLSSSSDAFKKPKTKLQSPTSSLTSMINSTMLTPSLGHACFEAEQSQILPDDEHKKKKKKKKSKEDDVVEQTGKKRKREEAQVGKQSKFLDTLIESLEGEKKKKKHVDELGTPTLSHKVKKRRKTIV